MNPSNTQKPPVKRSNKKKKRKLRVKNVLILVCIILLIPAVIALGFAVKNFFQPLELKAENYTVEYKSDFDPLDNLKAVHYGKKSDVETSGQVDSGKTGTYEMSYTYKDKEYPFTVTVADTKGPDLVLKDFTTDTIENVTAENFIESVSDASDYKVQLDDSKDEKKAGRTRVSVTAIDSAGNETTKTATLTRVNDKTAPEIADFTSEGEVMQGNEFFLHDYTATDDMDSSPSVTVDASALDVNTPGTYQVVYTTADRSGNEKQFIQNVTVKEDPDYGKKVVYLTFDDGPSENTQAILDILKKYNVPATFFVTGINTEYFPLMKEIVDNGNTIALHTMTHDYATLYSSDEAYFNDLQQISDLVEQQTGVKANCIRFPGGSSNMVSSDYSQGIMTRLTQSVLDKGYQYFDWNEDSTDASGFGIPASTLIANATDAIDAGMDRVNILFHDATGKDTTVQALPQIIQAYKNAGYVFRGVSVDGFAPHHDVNN